MERHSPEDLTALVQRYREAVEEVVIPLEQEILTEEKLESLLDRLQEVRQEMKQRGLWAPHLPTEYGGLGLPLLAFARVSEELGRSPIGHYAFNCQAPDVGNMEILLEFGTAQQKERYLRPLASGEIRSCFAMTEPEHAGSNPVIMSTVATKDGGDYRITGHKWFATAADGAAFAIVMAVTDADAKSQYARASQIIVPTDTPGYALVENISVMGERGSGFASHGELRFSDCRVPQSNRLGGEGAGFAIAQERLGPGRIHHCMRWIGICERAFDLMCRQSARRELAPGKVLGTRQIVQSWIAESRAEINAARLLVMDAAAQIDTVGVYAAREAISLIKFYVAGVLQRVLDRAIQTHGALGMTDRLPLAYWFRHERAARIYDGPDEVHKMVVAKRILRKYGVSVQR